MSVEMWRCDNGSSGITVRAQAIDNLEINRGVICLWCPLQNMRIIIPNSSK